MIGGYFKRLVPQPEHYYNAMGWGVDFIGFLSRFLSLESRRIYGQGGVLVHDL
jgi:hypothetical protein